MEIILMEKVVNLGQLGDVVTVKDGYARNFLIPKGFAKRANAANRKLFEERRVELEKAQAEKLAEAQARAAKLEGLRVEVAQKAGVDGRLFGSVGNVDIADAINAKGIEITRAEIRMPEGPFKLIGEYTVSVALHHDVVVDVTVVVVPEA